MAEMFVEEGSSPAERPLVAVTFQRDAHRKKKYLEAEPKALGITQIGLSVYKILCVGVFQAKGLSHLSTGIPLFISSLLVVIAGHVAVAAQSLHLSTLRACLVMQVVACAASTVNIVCTLLKLEEFPYFYWDYNMTSDIIEISRQTENIHAHFYAEGVVIQVALLAISITLAAYCCKVVNCCGPAPKMPVIMVQHLQANSDNTIQANRDNAVQANRDNTSSPTGTTPPVQQGQHLQSNSDNTSSPTGTTLSSPTGTTPPVQQ